MFEMRKDYVLVSNHKMKVLKTYVLHETPFKSSH